MYQKHSKKGIFLANKKTYLCYGMQMVHLFSNHLTTAFGHCILQLMSFLLIKDGANIMFGPQKPNMLTFLKPFTESLSDLHTNELKSIHQIFLIILFVEQCFCVEPVICLPK